MNSVETSKVIDDGNYEKYHLRIKDAKQNSTVPYSDHTAATSGNFMNLRSKKLALGTDKQFVDSEQQNI
jgi:hypothetical protein